MKRFLNNLSHRKPSVHRTDCLGGMNNLLNSNDSLLASYLAGLTEGDGSIIPVRSKKDKTKYIGVVITFVFCLADEYLANYLRNHLNIGVIRKETKVKAVTWKIISTEEVFNFLQFINGYLRTAKIVTLGIAFQIYENKYGVHVPLKPLNKTPILEDAWFAGFSDADASFQLAITKKASSSKSSSISLPVGTPIACTPKYELQIAALYEHDTEEYTPYRDNKIFLNLIAEAFSVKVQEGKNPSKRKNNNKPYEYIRVVINRYNNSPLLIDYFSRFPLFSSKFHNFLDWKKAFDLRLDTKNKGGKFLPLMPIFLSIKSGMNTARPISSLSWDHLHNSFYLPPVTFPTTKLPLWKRRK